MQNKKLIVIGDGPEMSKVKSKATKNVEILGYQSNEIMQSYMKNAKAFVFAAEEDFGITPVEAQACGTPVIAFGKGGSLETVRPLSVDRPTGILFDTQDIKSIIESVEKFEQVRDTISHIDCREHALKFSTERFNREISNYVSAKYQHFLERKKIIY
jgi:glycosyltransferase involved in cell wall biosynthesis